MSDDQTFEVVQPDGFMEPRRYRVRCQCERCGHVYHSAWAKAPPRRDPPCPRKKCIEAAARAVSDAEIERLQQMLLEQRGPPTVGANVQVRATDATADIVMADYGMTDLKDNIRQGESMAPPLPPNQQQRADAYFGGGGLKTQVPVLAAPGEPRHTMSGAQLNRLGRKAIAGAFRGMAMSPAAIMPDAARGSSPLRLVRTEPTGKKG